jgi:hypothetical protein
VWGVRLRGVLLSAVLLGISVGAARLAAADIASDHPAAILVFPKLLVETSEGLDTMVRITNVSDTAINVYCFYVNTTPQCSLDQATSCFPDKLACFRSVDGDTVSGACLPQWQETDFTFQLTRDQPTGWLVSAGEGECDFIRGVCLNDGTTSCQNDSACPSTPGNRCVKPPCLPLDGGPLGRIGPGGDLNSGAVPLSPEDPFIGELKCIAVDSSLAPVARNDLIGEVLIGRQQSGPENAIEVAGYNAIGIPALVNTCQANGTCSLTGTTCRTDQNCEATNNRDNTLVIGGQNTCQTNKQCSLTPTGPPCGTDADCPLVSEYEGCPNILILDHFFDGAVDPLVTNICTADGTCSVSSTACTSDNDCVDNICLDTRTCSVTGTPCTKAADCENSCVTTNTCPAGSCTVTGEKCTTNGDCANNFCSLSRDHCLQDIDCTDPVFRPRVVTNLTLVPCTEDFENQRPELSKTTAQFLIFNEFEQRFSTSTPVECFKETRLSNIETQQNANSIFSVGVEGTLTGQTRIRGVISDDPTVAAKAGNALLGVVEEFRCAGPKYQFPLCNFVDNPEQVISSTAKNLHFQGRRPQSDFIYLPAH